MGKIFSAIEAKEGSVAFQVGEEKSLEEWMIWLNTPSLFSRKQVLYLDGIDKWKKNDLGSLALYAANPSAFSYLLLGAHSAKGLTELCAKGKKGMIICDLSEEKPWDKKDRFKRHLTDLVLKRGKRIHPDAFEQLFENVDLNLPSLEQEIEKLITYVGDKQEISLADLLLLCSSQKSLTLWQLAEAVIWKETPPKLNERFDLSMLLPLITQLRTQLQQGMTLAILIEAGRPREEIAHHLPQLKTSFLDKILPLVKRRRSTFFKRGLDLLFDAELLAKNSGLDPTLIFDLFLSKITLLKRYYAAA